MATKEALKTGDALSRAKGSVIVALEPLGDGLMPAWRTVKAAIRAAIKVGEIRERGRTGRRTGRAGV